MYLYLRRFVLDIFQFALASTARHLNAFNMKQFAIWNGNCTVAVECEANILTLVDMYDRNAIK